MNARIRMLAWEQRRLLSWVLGAVAFSVVGSVIASISLMVPDSPEAAASGGMFGRILCALLTRITERDAVGLADAYAVIALLLTLFGALLPDGAKMLVDLPNRLLRLPLASRQLAWAWVLSRGAVVGAAILAVLMVRLAFVNLPSKLMLVPGFCYYLGGFLLFQGVVRLVSAWNEKAAVIAVIALAAVLGFAESLLWPLSTAVPVIPLIVGAGIGLPMATSGMLLRRRGGIVFDIGIPRFLGRETAFARVSEIPAFSMPVEAQYWYEKKRHGWHFPAFCLVGVLFVLGVAFFDNLNDPDERFNINPMALLTSFLVVPVLGAVMMALQFAVRDNWFSGRSRFLHVRPLNGMTFVRARMRMLSQSAIWGLTLTSFAFLAGQALILWAYGRPALHNEHGVYESSALRAITLVAHELFPVHYDYLGGAAAGTGADFVWMVVCFAVVLVALFQFANRYLLMVLAGSLITGGILAWNYEPVPHGEWLGRVILLAAAPAVLVLLSTWSALRSGVISARSALQVVLCWLVFSAVSLTFYIEVTNTLLAYTFLSVAPFGGWLAVALCGPLAAALAFDAKRSGSIMAPRRAGAATGWAEARGLLLGTAVALSLIVAGVVGWRGMVTRSVRDELSLANSMGVGPRSAAVTAPESAWRLSQWNLDSIVAAQQVIGTDLEPGSRRVRCDSFRLRGATMTDVIVPADGADLTAEELGLLETLSPDLETISTAVLKLTSAPERADTAPSSESLVAALKNAAVQGGLLAILGAERRDPDLAYRGLQTAALLLRGLHAEPTPHVEGWQEFAVALQRVLNRLALPGTQLDALLQLLPAQTSREQFMNTLKVPRQQLFWETPYEKKYGYREYYGRPELLIRGAIEECLLLPGAAYATTVNAASETLAEHDACLRGQVAFRRVDGRRSYYGIRDYAGVVAAFSSVNHVRVVTAHEQLHLEDAAVGMCRAALILEKHRLAQGAYPEYIEVLTPEERLQYPNDWSQTGTLSPIPMRRISDVAFSVRVAWIDQQDNLGGDGDLAIEVSRP